MQNVAVVIPAHNEEKYIKNALLSLQKQTIRPVAIIVANDGSTDSTADVVNEFKRKYEECFIHLINLERSTGYGRGIVRNLNKGKKWLDENSIQYDFLMILDADHLLSGNYLELCMKEFNSNTAIVGGKTYGTIQLRREKKRISTKWLRGGHRIYSKWFIDQNPFPQVRSWDSYHIYTAIDSGYEVKVAKDALALELRTSREKIYHDFSRGIYSYRLGYSFPFLLVRACKSLLSGKIRAIAMPFGFLYAMGKREQKYPIAPKVAKIQKKRIIEFIMRY